MQLFRRNMNSDDLASAVKVAVADATNALTLATHMAQCEKDKGEMKAEQLRMHQENTKKFEQLFRVIWIAAGVAAALSVGGREILAKLLGV